MKNVTHTIGSLLTTRKLIASSISTILLTGACFASAPVFAQEEMTEEEKKAKEEVTEIIDNSGGLFRSCLHPKRAFGYAYLMPALGSGSAITFHLALLLQLQHRLRGRGA